MVIASIGAFTREPPPELLALPRPAIVTDGQVHPTDHSGDKVARMPQQWSHVVIREAIAAKGISQRTVATAAGENGLE